LNLKIVSEVRLNSGITLFPLCVFDDDSKFGMNDELIIVYLLLTTCVEFNQAMMSEQRRILPGSWNCSVKQCINRATPVDAD